MRYLSAVSLCGAVLFTASAAGTALAQSADVGLVNFVAGDVAYAAGSAPRAPVRAFMRVREGDRFHLSDSSQLRVVFFDARRQELWHGPASFRVRRTGSEPLAGAPKSVTDLPAAVPQQLGKIPALMQTARLGGIQVRSAPTQHAAPAASSASSPGDARAAIREARNLYRAMRRDAGAEDIAPELFLFAVLDEHQRYEEMQDVVEEMIHRQPGNDELKALAAWVERKAAESGHKKP